MIRHTHSVIDKSRSLFEDTWVVSLVAKPEGRNPEHAILLVEGLVGDKCLFRRYDYVVGEPIPEVEGRLATAANLVKRKKGLVVVKEKECDFDDTIEERAQFFWAMVMNDRLMNEGCEGLSWSLTNDKAETLNAAVLESQRNPPDYQISGQHSLIASSSSQSGHNCYTWARQKLIELNVEDIKHDDRLAPCLADYCGARTTTHIAPPARLDSSNRRGAMTLFS